MNSAYRISLSPTGVPIRRESEIEAPPTGAPLGWESRISATRTIGDIVDKSGHLRNRTRILVNDSEHLHSLAEEQHSSTLESELRTRAHQRAGDGLTDLLEWLGDLGFSWRDVARLAGVSVPALRKWRSGGSATGKHRHRIARVVAFCEIAKQRYLIPDVAGWLETPLHPEAPVTGLDLLADGRFDLMLRLARDRGADPETTLEEFEPGWREHYTSPVEVFTAADGMPGLRLADTPN